MNSFGGERMRCSTLDHLRKVHFCTRHHHHRSHDGALSTARKCCPLGPCRYYWKGEIQDASEILMVSSEQLLRRRPSGVVRCDCCCSWWKQRPPGFNRSPTTWGERFLLRNSAFPGQKSDTFSQVFGIKFRVNFEMKTNKLVNFTSSKLSVHSSRVPVGVLTLVHCWITVEIGFDLKNLTNVEIPTSFWRHFCQQC